jgi:flagellar hook-associated protein 2
MIKTGDGSTGEFTSTIEVEFDSSDPTQTNKSVMEKIRTAINSDKAVVNSNTFSGSASYTGGPGTLKLNLNGTETEISYNGGGTYEELIDEIVTNITANTTGVVAEKVIDSPNPGDVSLKLTVTDSSKYISISHSTGGNVVTDLNIGVTKEKGASGIITAAAFSPDSTNSQFSLTAKSTGLDFRIKELTDLNGGTALNFLGLNFGTSRQEFEQSADLTDTPGFIYNDISGGGNLLNSKINFNGLDIQRNSNTVNDLVSGVAFTLKSVMQSSDTTVNVSVKNDVSSIKGKIEDFVTKFNEVYSYIKTNSTSSKTGRGIFIGDSNASSILNNFASTAYTPVTGIVPGNLNTLSQLGITFNSTNGLVISDSGLLEVKLTENIDQVENLFNSVNGIATKLFSSVTPYTSSTGYLANSISALTTNIKGLDDKLTSVQARINKTGETLRAQYQRLQLQLASLMDMSGNFSDSQNYF